MDDHAKPASPEEAFLALLEWVGAKTSGTVFVMADSAEAHPLTDGFMCLAMSKLKSDSGIPAYEHIAHLRLSTREKCNLPKLVMRRQCSGATMDAVVSALDELPDKTAVFIPQMHEVWVGHDQSEPKDTVSSWTAPLTRVQRRNDRASHAFTKLIPALVNLAKQKQLLIVSICTLNKSIWDALPNEVQSLDGFCFANITSPSGELYDAFEERMAVLITDAKAGQKTFEDAENELRTLAPSEAAGKQAVAYLLSRFGRHHEAWKEISPILPLLAMTEVHLMMGIARMALDALDAPACEDWIARARSRGITQLQDWAVGVLLAQAMRNHTLETELTMEMADHFPNHEIVLYWKLRRAVSAGDLTEGIKLARRLNRNDVANAFEAIANREPIPLVVRQTHNEQDRNLALLAMMYARAGDNPSLAWAATKQIPSAAIQKITALCFWWDKWSAEAMAYESDGSLAECEGQNVRLVFAELIKESLPLSRDAKLRQAVDAALMSTLTPTVAERYLVDLLVPALLDSAQQAYSKPWTLFIDMNGEEASDVEFASFTDAIGIIERRQHHLFGQATLPATAIPLVSARIGVRLISGLQMIAPDPSSNDTSLMILDIISAVSRHLGDPSFDVMAALIVASCVAQAGDEQFSRNVAEGVLAGFPIPSDDFYSWRLGGAWLVVAESLVSGGGARQALLPLLYAAALMNQRAVDAMLVSRLLNVASRALRDIGRTKEAIQVNEKERELLMGRNQEFLVTRNRHYALMLRISELDSSDIGAVQAALDDVMEEIRKLKQSEERSPLLWMAANLVRFLRLGGVCVPINVIEELSVVSEADHPYSSKAAHLRVFLSEEVTVDWLVSELERSTRAVRVEDADSQFKRLAMLSRSGFKQAVRDNAADLALAVLATRCQPALLGRKQAMATNLDRSVRAFREHLAELVKRNPTESLRDQMEALQERGRPRLIEVDWQRAVSPEQVSSMLEGDELLVGLCVLDDHSMGILEMGKMGGAELSTRSSDEWNELLWEGARPYPFDRLNDHDQSQMLRELVEKPLINTGSTVKHVTVVPETSLFGLPLAMALGEPTHASPALSIAPSIAWLSWMRAMGPRSFNEAVAWLGHATHDASLSALHQVVRPTLDHLGFIVLPDLLRETIGNPQLVLVSAHGVLNNSNEVVGITDDKGLRTSAQLSSILAQSQCVVLACCSVGTGQKPVGSNESWGVVAALLAEGVPCVIAPVWPITAGHLNRWLPAFVASLRSGLTVAESVKQANFITGDRLQDKVAFQVFGDGIQRLTI